MSSPWNAVRLGDLAEVKGGKRLPKGEQLQLINNGAPYIRITDWSNGVIDQRALMYVPKSAQSAIEKYRIYCGEVFISIVGTIGLIADIPASLDGAFLTENAAKICPKSSDLDSSYLKYVLSSSYGKNAIVERAVGSTQPKLALHRIKDIAIPLPPLFEQRGIAEVLGALDDKIAANTKLAATSMGLAETYFRKTVHLATDERALGEILSLEYGKSLPTSSRVAGLVDVYGSGGITGSHNEALCPDPGVVVGRKGTAGAVHWSHRPFFPIDTTFYVVPSHHAVSQVFCYFLLRTLGLDEMNNDSAVPGLNRNQAHASRIMLPSESALDEFTELATKLFCTAAQAERGNSTLVLTRNALLPHLMSGKLRVKDAEKVLEDAGV